MYTIEYGIVFNGLRVIVEAMFIAGFLRVKARPGFVIAYMAACITAGILTGSLIGLPWVNTLVHVAIMCAAGTFLLRRPASSVLAPCIIVETAFALASALWVLIFELAGPPPPAMPAFLRVFLPTTIYVITQSLACFVLLYILKNYRNLDEKYTATYLPLLLLPCMLTIFVTHFNWNLWRASMPVGSEITGVTPTQALRDFVILLFAFLAFVAVLTAFYRLIEAAKRDATRVNLEQQMKAQQQYVTEAKQRNEQYRSFQHDINNHFTVLSGLFSSGENEEAAQYLQKIKTGASAGGATQAVSTGNLVLDVLLGEKIAYAKREGIGVTWNMHLAARMGVDDFDLCILFANAMDNAVCGCMESMEDEKSISIVAKVKNSFLFLQMENTCLPGKQVAWGTGLKNMKATVDKYGGSIDIEVKKTRFIISILLCLPAKQ